MAKPHRTLSRGLDREVYAAMTKYLASTDTQVRDATVDGIYTYVKRSNSSLGRKSKVLLEDCITRILDIMRADDSSDGLENVDVPDVADTSHGPPGNDGEGAANAMNRRLVADWNLDSSKPTTVASSGRPKRPQPNGTDAPTETDRSAKERTRKRAKTEAAKVPQPVPEPAPEVKLADVAGMDGVLRRIESLVWLPFSFPERLQLKKRSIPRGVLLHGPVGCGKTMLCKALAHALHVPIIHITPASVIGAGSGDSEKAIREHFDKAVEVAPALIMLDEIDALAPKRDSAQRQMESRIVSQLVSCMDDLSLERTGGRPVMVLAATNRPHTLDPALRRAGRFDEEIHMDAPDVHAREAILRQMTRELRLAPDVDLERVARLTPGFVGADLSSLVREAHEPSDQRLLARLHALVREREADAVSRSAEEDVVEMAAKEDVEMADTRIDDHSLPTAEMSVGRRIEAMSALLDERPALRGEYDSETEVVTMADLVGAVRSVKSSTTREGFATIPDMPWNAVGAYHAIRSDLQKRVIAPISTPRLYQHFGMSPPGILLHGPPGCGKTMLAKAIASAASANFMTVKGAELLNKYVGESEKGVRQLFARARQSQPVIVFFDELDALVPRRDDARNDSSNRVVNAMLVELDGIESREEVYIIAATNRPDSIDPAVKRSGRLGLHLYVGLPRPDERVEILATILRRRPVRPDARPALADLARACHRFSGADLQNLAEEASMAAIDRCSVSHLADPADSYIELVDVQTALEKTRRTRLASPEAHVVQP